MTQIITNVHGGIVQKFGWENPSLGWGREEGIGEVLNTDSLQHHNAISLLDLFISLGGYEKRLSTTERTIPCGKEGKYHRHLSISEMCRHMSPNTLPGACS